MRFLEQSLAMTIFLLIYNCPCIGQVTFKETTNSYKMDKIASHFYPLFFGKGGYGNFRTDSTSSSENIIKVPEKFRKIKGEAMFFYELDTLATIKKIWIAGLKISGSPANSIIDRITFVDHNHIGFELDYLKEIDFDQRRKSLAVFLLENEWKTRKFRRQRDKKWFDKTLGNEYIHLLPVRFESED